MAGDRESHTARPFSGLPSTQAAHGRRYQRQRERRLLAPLVCCPVLLAIPSLMGSIGTKPGTSTSQNTTPTTTSTTVYGQPSQGEYGYNITHSRTTTKPGAGQGSTASVSSSPGSVGFYRSYVPPTAYAPYPAISNSTAPACRYTAYRAFTASTQAEAVSEANSFEENSSNQQSWLRIVGRFRPCPAAPPAPPTAVPPSPPVVAVESWIVEGSKELPRPVLRVAPGYGITGAPSYVVDTTPLAWSTTVPTPIGPLVLHAQGELTVSFGDGSAPVGPVPYPGRPWPATTKTITHTWQATGSYTIRATVSWSGTWSLDNMNGVLPALVTHGEIRGFSVRQVVGLQGN
jgi:hypothetical protein